MLTCFNVQTTHFSNIVHYCRSSMPCLSQLRCFLQSPYFQQAQSALIGQLTQFIMIGRTRLARVGNVTPLTIIASFSFLNKCRQLIMSWVLSSVQARERNRVTWQTQWWCLYVFAVHSWLCCDVTLSLSHTHNALCPIYTSASNLRHSCTVALCHTDMHLSKILTARQFYEESKRCNWSARTPPSVCSFVCLCAL